MERELGVWRWGTSPLAPQRKALGLFLGGCFGNGLTDFRLLLSPISALRIFPGGCGKEGLYPELLPPLSPPVERVTYDMTLQFIGGKYQFKKMIYLVLERGEGKEKERERNIDVRETLISCPSCTSWGPGQQPRHVP